MSKIIDHIANWYQEVASRDYYNENDLERTVMMHLEVIFPEFNVFPFKQSLSNNITGKKSSADLGMVKKDYSEWYVIEIELGKHTKEHVVEQIETFRNFTPSIENVTYIKEKRDGVFDFNSLKYLILNKQPELMVIVNEQKDDWKSDFLRLGCKMCIFQIYNDFDGKKMFRINGDHPFIFTDFCNCRYEKMLPFTVNVLKNDFLQGYGINDGAIFPIEYNGVDFLWERRDAGSEIFLICKNPHSPLDPLSSRYRLNYNSGRKTFTFVKD